MSIVVFIFTLKYIPDINAQPKIFPYNLTSKILYNPPKNFNLDLHLLLIAKKYDYEIKYLNVNFKKRQSSKAKGAGSFKGIILVSMSVFRYLITGLIRKNYK